MSKKTLFNYLCCLILASGFLASTLQAQDTVQAQDNEDPLAGVKCVVSGTTSANLDYYADHLEGRVYFCCPKCVAKFKEDHSPYLTKANHQLVLTGQYEQTACPISGGKFDADKPVNVGGAEVGFCCESCLGQVNHAADLPAKAELVFGEKAFAKGFEKVLDLSKITCPISGGPVAKENVAEYLDCQVYFCCPGCAASFSKDPSKHAIMANYQLVATGQFVQRGCPFSGKAVLDEAMTQVGALEVGFCNTGCRDKVANMADAKEQISSVFSAEAFKNGFEQKKKQD